MKQFSICISMFCMHLATFSQANKIQVCVVDKGVLKIVEADYDGRRGDTTVMIDGKKKKFSDIYASTGNEYAASATWYISHEPIMVLNKSFVKYGLPRVLGTTEISRINEYKGIGVYAETGTQGLPEVIYIPVRSGCEFQPYIKEAEPCAKLVVSPSVQLVTAGSIVIFSATVTGTTEKINYAWSISDGKMITSPTGKTITVSTNNVKKELTATLKISIEGADCTKTGYATVKIK